MEAILAIRPLINKRIAKGNKKPQPAFAQLGWVINLNLIFDIIITVR